MSRLDKRKGECKKTAKSRAVEVGEIVVARGAGAP